MKKILIILISGIIMYLGANIIFISQEIMIDMNVLSIDAFLTFMVRTIVGIIGATLIALGAHTIVFQISGISLVSELQYSFIGNTKKNKSRQ